MSFFFVDRILAYEPGKFIRGIKNVTRSEPFFYWLPDGKRVLSPAVISEGLLQLGGWLKLVTTDFTKRPVILADERTEYRGFVEAGDQVELLVEVLDFGDDVVVTKGRATVDGRDIVVGECARGYLLPIEELSDPTEERRKFANLYRPETTMVPFPDGAKRLLPACGGRSFEHLAFVDGLVSHEPYRKVVGFKNFSACEPYFQDHFKFKPCVPGVLQLTFVGEVCQYLIKEDIYAPTRSRALIPTFIENVRFRKFVEPGDVCFLEAELMDGDPTLHDSDIRIRAVIKANDKRVMQADMGFRTMFGSDLTMGRGQSRLSPELRASF